MAQDQINQLEAALRQSELNVAALERQLEEKRDQLEKDRAVVMAAKEMLSRHTRPNTSRAAPIGPPNAAETIRNGSIREAMRATIPMVAKRNRYFGTTEIVEFWHSLPEEERPNFDIENKPNISRAIKELWDEGFIKREEEPKGRSQALYSAVQ